MNMDYLFTLLFACFVPNVYEMCRIAHFTYIQNIPSGVISFPYNELALPVGGFIHLRICGIALVIAISVKGDRIEGKGCFSVFPRKLNSEKVVFYYQCYDENGNRSSGLSTEQVTKTAARVYCMRLYREGNLFPHKRHIPTFGEYAVSWWDWDTCDYLKNQKGRKDITQAYANNCRKMVKNQILPYFGKTRLDKITSEDINNWLLGFKERKAINADGKEEVRGYKNTYANTVFGTFWLMLNEAVNRKLISSNPAAAVRKLKNDRKAIEIITPAEVRLLFPRQWETIGVDDWISYLGNKLVACTGMRASEILGLRGEHIFDEYPCLRPA